MDEIVANEILQRFGAGALLILFLLPTIVSIASAILTQRWQQKHERKIKRLESQLDTRNHISKAQFDQEFITYKKLWEDVVSTKERFIDIFRRRPQAQSKFLEQFQEFSENVMLTRCFCAPEVYDATIHLITYMTQSTYLPENESETIDEVNRRAYEISDAIRKRLTEVSVGEGQQT